MRMQAEQSLDLIRRVASRPALIEPALRRA
jgi:hypothetical protein